MVLSMNLKATKRGKKNHIQTVFKTIYKKNKDILPKNIYKKLTKDAPMVTTCLLPPVFGIYQKRKKKKLIYADKHVMHTH